MENQRVSGRYLGCIQDDLVGVRRLGISTGAPGFMRENALAERACGQGIAFLAVGSGIGIAHGFCPFGGLFPDQPLANWMIHGDAGATTCCAKLAWIPRKSV